MAQAEVAARKSESAEDPQPELDFEGNVNVNHDLPTKEMLDQCADMLLLDSQGRSRPFKSLCEDENVAPRQMIIFVRHFFCGNCQEYLRTLSSSITPDDLLSLPTPTFITVIGCGKPELIDMYIQTTNCPFPVYADPTRKLYDILGMQRTLDLGKKPPKYMQASLAHAMAHSMVQVVRSGSSAFKGGDIKQVGGEFLFERGQPIWCHRMRNTRGHVEVPELRRVLGLDESRPPMRKTWSSGIKEFGKRSRSNSWARSRSKGVTKEAAERDSMELELEQKGLLEDKPAQTAATAST